MAQQTYLGSLWTQDDTKLCGLDYEGNFYGKFVSVETLQFSDGTQLQSAAGVSGSLITNLDMGTF